MLVQRFLNCFTSGRICDSNVQDTVGVDIEGDLNPWNVLRCGWYTVQDEAPKATIPVGTLVFALKYVDLD